MDRCIHKHLTAPDHCEIDGTCPGIDVLMLSGGGDRGAFGSGFLKGWGEVTGHLKRPQFDLVTGVSTGALIAPYAFIGTDDAYAAIDEHYRNPDPGWARRRISRAVLARSGSLFDTRGLKKFIVGQLDNGFIAALADGNAQGRKLLIGTTNAHMGLMRPWDLTDFASTVHCDNCIDHMARVLLASIAIPGAFPPVEIHGDLYVDGGVTMQVFLPGARKMVSGIAGPVEELRAKGVRIPEIRVWVIINNALAPEPASVDNRWYAILSRSLNTAIRTTAVLALRDLQMFCGLASSTGVHIQMRYVAIPDDFVDPPTHADMFDKGVMTALSDLGRQMGRDPKSWHDRVPSPESADTYDLQRPSSPTRHTTPSKP